MKPTAESKQHLITELQSRGVRLLTNNDDHVNRRGGAGPSDHQAIVIDDVTLMVPVHTRGATTSPFVVKADDARDNVQLSRGDIPLTDVTFADTPAFYRLSTADGIPYSHIATLHGTDVLATTVLQSCVHYRSKRKACRFCAIGQSLASGRTIERKQPEQLAEVAKAAVELDGVKHMVMTTGTPATADRGAAILCESVTAVKAVVDLPIQVQCEPPSDHDWFRQLKAAGADSLGMHLEIIDAQLREQLIPGKAKVSVADYLTAFAAAVDVFGRGQVSTYLLAGLGDSEDVILSMCDELIALGVYPFVVPFVPIRGTPLEHHTPPSAEFMTHLLNGVGQRLAKANLLGEDTKAGCARCGACSTQSRYEQAFRQSSLPSSSPSSLPAVAAG